jgi:hypothetical protein
LQHLEAFVGAKTALALERRAVGLVIAGLEDVLRPDRVAGFLHPARDHLGMIRAFQLAGSGDDRKGAVIA